MRAVLLCASDIVLRALDTIEDDFCIKCANHALKEIKDGKTVPSYKCVKDDQQPPPQLGERWLSMHCGPENDEEK